MSSLLFRKSAIKERKNCTVDQGDTGVKTGKSSADELPGDTTYGEQGSSYQRSY